MFGTRRFQKKYIYTWHFAKRRNWTDGQHPHTKLNFSFGRVIFIETNFKIQMYIRIKSDKFGRIISLFGKLNTFYSLKRIQRYIELVFSSFKEQILPNKDLLCSKERNIRLDEIDSFITWTGMDIIRRYKLPSII